MGQPRPGDHIYCKRAAGLYDHHGIYVGDGMVIHLMGAAKKIGPLGPCQKCGDKRVCNGEIFKTCIDCFLEGHSLKIYEYGVSSCQFNRRRPGTCSTFLSKPAHEVIQTATDFLENNKFGSYNMFSNNCENFAVYCKSGKDKVSRQVVGHIQEAAIAVPIGIAIAGAFAPPAAVVVVGAYALSKVFTGFIRRL